MQSDFIVTLFNEVLNLRSAFSSLVQDSLSFLPCFLLTRAWDQLLVRQFINPLCCPLGVKQTPALSPHKHSEVFFYDYCLVFFTHNSPSFHRGCAIFSSWGALSQDSQLLAVSMIPLQYPNTTTYQTHTHTHSFTFGGCSMFPEVSLSHTVRRVNICNALAIGVVRCLSNSVVYCCRENRWQSGFHFPAAQQASDALWSRYCVTIWNWCILLLLLALMSSSCPGSLHSKLEVRATPSSVLAHCSNSNKHPKTHPSGAVVAASMPERSPRKGPPRSLFVFLILIYFLFD